MWSSMKIAALALVALSSASVNAQSTTTTTTTTTTCTVGGLTVSNNFRYVTGRKNIEGSIYATCADSKPQCYVDTRVRDAATAESISCDDDVIHESRRRLGVYMSGSDHYWPQGVVCYSYGSSFTATQQSVFTNAMNEYHTKTAVRFVTLDECKSQYPTACGGCTQAFQIVSAAGANDCYATLGYAPSSRMDLNFGSGCFNGDGGFRVAVHELGHVIGLIHEHTHPNRQVVVLRSDLTLSPDNYMKEKNGATTSYDSGSVMHYSRETGICIPKNLNTVYCDIDQSESDGCVVPTSDMCDDASDTNFGRATTLAPSDIATIAKIYGSGGQVAPTPAPSTPTTAPVTTAPVTPAPSTPTNTPVPVPPTTPATQSPVVTPVVTPVATTPSVYPAATPSPSVPVAPVVAPAPSAPASVAPVATPAASVPTSVSPVDTTAPSTATPATAAPVQTVTPATATPTTAAPVETTAPVPVPAPVAEPSQGPNQDTATDNSANNTWDQMNQQTTQMTTEYPADRTEDEEDTSEVPETVEPADDDVPADSSEVRGAAATTPAPVTASSGGAKPHICDY